MKHLTQTMTSATVCGAKSENLTSSPALTTCPECLAGDLLAAPAAKVRVNRSDLLAAYAESMKGDNYTDDERRRYMEYAKDDIGGWLGERIPDLMNLGDVDYWNVEIVDDRDAEPATDSRVTDILSGRETWSQCKAIVTRKFAQDLNDADRDRLIKYVSDNVNMSRESQNDAAFKGDLEAARACELAGNAWQSIFTNLWEFSGGPVSYANRANGVAEPPAHVCDQYGVECPGCEFDEAANVAADQAHINGDPEPARRESQTLRNMRADFAGRRKYSKGYDGLTKFWTDNYSAATLQAALDEMDGFPEPEYMKPARYPAIEIARMIFNRLMPTETAADVVREDLNEIMRTVDRLATVVTDRITVPDAEYNRIVKICAALETIKGAALDCRREIRGLADITPANNAGSGVADPEPAARKVTQAEVKSILADMRKSPIGETVSGEYVFQWQQRPPRGVGYYLQFVWILRKSDRVKVASFKTTNLKGIAAFLAFGPPPPIEL